MSLREVSQGLWWYAKTMIGLVRALYECLMMLPVTIAYPPAQGIIEHELSDLAMAVRSHVQYGATTRRTENKDHPPRVPTILLLEMSNN